MAKALSHELLYNEIINHWGIEIFDDFHLDFKWNVIWHFVLLLGFMLSFEIGWISENWKVGFGEEVILDLGFEGRRAPSWYTGDVGVEGIFITSRVYLPGVYLLAHTYIYR